MESIITIGSPFARSPTPYYGLLEGYTFGNLFATKWFMKTLLQNAPSAYQLLPQYDSVVGLNGETYIPNWKPGQYRLELIVEGKTISNGIFKMVE